VEARRTDPDATQSVDRTAPKKRKPNAPTEVETKKSKMTKTKKGVAELKAKKTRKPRIAFTPESRQPGKRAATDSRPRHAAPLIDDDDDDDEDFEVGGGDDDDEEEEEDDVVAGEGGAVELDDDEEEEEAADDDNATVAISNPRDDDDGDARLMSSTRPKSRANVARGDPDAAVARRIAAIESEFESDVDAGGKVAAAATTKSKRKKAADGESVATVEKSAAAASAKSRRRGAVEKAQVGDDPYDIDAVLQKNAKKFKLVSRSASEPITTVSVRKHVSRKSRDGESATMVYRLLHLDRTRRCAYSRAELMRQNKDSVPRIDMDNFLHFAAVDDGKYKMADVMSFLVDKNDMMCACPRRTLLQLLFLDQNLDYAQFRDFYNKLPEYIDMNNDDKIPPVPPALYTSGEIRKSKRKSAS
jgi:hypothetical protein